MSANNLKDILKSYDKIYILNMNMSGAGFGALILTTLSQLRYCERNNFYPVINYDQTCNSAFLDTDYGNNLWLQYFQPVMPVGYDDVQNSIANEELLIEDCITLPNEEMLKIAIEHPDSVYSYTFGKWRFNKSEDLLGWYDNERKKGRETVQKYVKINAQICKKVDDFCYQNFGDGFVLGLHVRGTDLHYTAPVSPAEYFIHIDQFINEYPELKIFLATDQLQYLQVFIDKYGDRVCYTDVFRSDNEVAPFNRPELSPYLKGEEVLLDILLLSRTNFLLKGGSNVGEMAMYFNAELECLDLSLRKEKAFGQDYGDGWQDHASKSAWQLIKDKDLTKIPDDADKQSFAQKTQYKFNGYLSFFKRGIKFLLRR